MATGGYIGINGTARKMKKLYIGINGVARRVKKGYVGINGVARLFYSNGVEFSEKYSNPNPYDGNNTYSVTQKTGGFIMSLTARTSSYYDGADRTRLFVYLRGLNVGDVVSFTAVSSGDKTSYINGYIKTAAGTQETATYYMDMSSNKTVTVNHTVTNADGGGFNFYMSIGNSFAMYTSTITVTNLTVNGITVTP